MLSPFSALCVLVFFFNLHHRPGETFVYIFIYIMFNSHCSCQLCQIPSRLFTLSKQATSDQQDDLVSSELLAVQIYPTYKYINPWLRTSLWFSQVDSLRLQTPIRVSMFEPIWKIVWYFLTVSKIFNQLEIKRGLQKVRYCGKFKSPWNRAISRASFIFITSTSHYSYCCCL